MTCILLGMPSNNLMYSCVRIFFFLSAFQNKNSSFLTVNLLLLYYKPMETLPTDSIHRVMLGLFHNKISFIKCEEQSNAKCILIM